MTITGGIKFFESNKFLFKNGSNAFALTGSTAHYILNNNRNNSWTSVGSDDTITEGVAILLDDTYSISRLLLNDHNFKDVTIYLLSETSTPGAFSNGEWYRFIVQESSDTTDGSVQDAVLLEDGSYIKNELYTDFSSIASDPGLEYTITDTNIATSTSYYGFDAVSVKYIYFEVTTTQTANEQKNLKSLVGTNEIGTLAGRPQISTTFDRNTKQYRVLTNKSLIQRSVDAVDMQLLFESYPGQADYNILNTLYESTSPFHVWLCGGREGAPYFNYTIRGFGIDDLYLCDFVAPMDVSYTNSIFNAPYNITLNLTEVVG